MYFFLSCSRVIASAVAWPLTSWQFYRLAPAEDKGQNVSSLRNLQGLLFQKHKGSIDPARDRVCHGRVLGFQGMLVAPPAETEIDPIPFAPFLCDGHDVLQ